MGCDVLEQTSLISDSLAVSMFDHAWFVPGMKKWSLFSLFFSEKEKKMKHWLLVSISLVKSLDYYELCPFAVHYEAIMFYNTGTWNKRSSLFLTNEKKFFYD